MKEIKAPNKIVKDYNLSIFLAGSIEMDKAENWQNKVIEHFCNNEITFFNLAILDLGKSLTRGFAGHVDVNASRSFKPARHDLTEFVVSAAIQREFGSLHGSGCRNERKRRCAQRIFE